MTLEDSILNPASALLLWHSTVRIPLLNNWSAGWCRCEGEGKIEGWGRRLEVGRSQAEAESGQVKAQQLRQVSGVLVSSFTLSQLRS